MNIDSSGNMLVATIILLSWIGIGVAFGCIETIGLTMTVIMIANIVVGWSLIA